MYNLWVFLMVTSTLWTVPSANSSVLDLFPEYKADLDKLRSGIQSMQSMLKSEIQDVKNAQQNMESRLKTVEANAVRVVVCENEPSFHIACPNRIEIVRANYGREEGQNVCPGWNTRSINCRSIASENKIKSLCHGKKTCQLKPTNGEFGDTCHNFIKYVDVIYKCK